ncbi:hypothetical protein F4801DRAFT_529069 [Xylaria longipes]|nr:hypothetical protein F4801DRAFT_529069 [Xylaria longipes]
MSLVRGSQESYLVGSSSPLPGLDVIAQASPRADEITLGSRFTIGVHSAGASPPISIQQAEEGSGTHPPNDTAEAAEPAWVAGSDSDLINSLRSIVNVID